MERYTFKSTLLRSNPRVIREFSIDGRMTADQLLQTVAILHGLPDAGGMKLYRGPQALKGGTVLSDYMRGLAGAGEDETPVLEVRRTSPDTVGGQAPGYSFRLEPLDLEVVTDTQPGPPLLLRLRGLNLYEEVLPIAQHNALMQELESRGRSYQGWDTVSREDYVPDEDLIAGRLRRMSRGLDDAQLHTQLKGVMIVCCRLYGLFSREAASAVFKAMYPKAWKRETFDLLWQDLYLESKGAEDGEDAQWSFYDAENAFDLSCMNYTIVENILAAGTFNDCDYYVPGSQEAGQILQLGLTARPDLVRKLRPVLNQLNLNSYYYDREEMVRAIVRLAHLGYPAEDITESLKSNYLSKNNNAAALKRLQRTVTEVLPDIRAIRYRGHTLNEIRRQMMEKVTKRILHGGPAK